MNLGQETYFWDVTDPNEDRGFVKTEMYTHVLLKVSRDRWGFLGLAKTYVSLGGNLLFIQSLSCAVKREDTVRTVYLQDSRRSTLVYEIRRRVSDLKRTRSFSSCTSRVLISEQRLLVF